MRNEDKNDMLYCLKPILICYFIEVSQAMSWAFLEVKDNFLKFIQLISF